MENMGKEYRMIESIVGIVGMMVTVISIIFHNYLIIFKPLRQLFLRILSFIKKQMEAADEAKKQRSLLFTLQPAYICCHSVFVRRRIRI